MKKKTAANVVAVFFFNCLEEILLSKIKDPTLRPFDFAQGPINDPLNQTSWPLPKSHPSLQASFYAGLCLFGGFPAPGS